MSPALRSQASRAATDAVDAALAAFPPTLDAAHARIAAIEPDAYARTRNALDGAVSRLSPYLTHGFVTPAEVVAGVAARHRLRLQDKFVQELGWRAYFRHAWRHAGDAWLTQSRRAGPLPDAAYGRDWPADLRAAASGTPVADRAVAALQREGWLHNHARLWLAAHAVHGRKIHWRAGADWLYARLLDGDLGSNHGSWQWVAGTASAKPYLFDAANVARLAPRDWASGGAWFDAPPEALAAFAADAARRAPAGAVDPAAADALDPAPQAAPPAALGCRTPDAADVEGRDVWLVHPWALGAPPPGRLPVAVFDAGFHRRWPWSAARWAFVGARVASFAPLRWHGEAAAIAGALRGARSVATQADFHAQALLAACGLPGDEPVLFPEPAERCDSFSKWWSRATRGLARLEQLPGLR